MPHKNRNECLFGGRTHNTSFIYRYPLHILNPAAEMRPVLTNFPVKRKMQALVWGPKRDVSSRKVSGSLDKNDMVQAWWRRAVDSSTYQVLQAHARLSVRKPVVKCSATPTHWFRVSFPRLCGEFSILPGEMSGIYLSPHLLAN